MNQCIKCKKPIESMAPTGRPKDYCSNACRRAAEYEITRINRRLEVLEERLTWEGLTETSSETATRKKHGRMADIRAAIAETEARLKELLAGKVD